MQGIPQRNVSHKKLNIFQVSAIKYICTSPTFQTYQKYIRHILQYESLCRFLRYNPITSARRMSTQVATAPIIANGLNEALSTTDDGRPLSFVTVWGDESIEGISTRNDSRATSVGRSSDWLLESTYIWRRPLVSGRSWSHLAVSLKYIYSVILSLSFILNYRLTT